MFVFFLTEWGKRKLKPELPILVLSFAENTSREIGWHSAIQDKNKFYFVVFKMIENQNVCCVTVSSREDKDVAAIGS